MFMAITNNSIGMVHDSLVRVSGGVPQIPNILSSAARFLIFEFKAIYCDVNDHSFNIFVMFIVPPVAVSTDPSKEYKVWLLVSDQITEQENIETFSQWFQTLERNWVF